MPQTRGPLWLGPLPAQKASPAPNSGAGKGASTFFACGMLWTGEAARVLFLGAHYLMGPSYLNLSSRGNNYGLNSLFLLRPIHYF